MGTKINQEFDDLTISLMKKLGAKSEVELIKLFRLNLALMQKDSLKDKLRGLLFNSAFLKFVQHQNKDKLTLSDLAPFLEQKSQRT